MGPIINKTKNDEKNKGKVGNTFGFQTRSLVDVKRKMELESSVEELKI